MQALSSGDLTFISKITSNSEVGKIVSSVEDTMSQLNRVVGGINSVTNLTGLVNETGEKVDSLYVISQNVSESVTKLNHSVEHFKVDSESGLMVESEKDVVVASETA